MATQQNALDRQKINMFIRASVLRHFSETLSHSEKICVQGLISNNSVSYQKETGKRCKEHQNRP